METKKIQSSSQAMSIEIRNQIAYFEMHMEGKVNKINESFGVALHEMLEWLKEQPSLQGLVITSAHKDFCVGADIDRLYQQEDPFALHEEIKQIQNLFRTLETLPYPVVSVICGSALGGGYELALSTHYRISLDAPKGLIGLPEVSLGLIPGAGGTQRLPRLLGYQSSMELITQGQMLRPQKALDKKMIDLLVSSKEEGIQKALEWIASNPKAKQPWDRSSFQYPAPLPATEDARNMLMVAGAMLMKKTAGVYEAPKLAISAIHEGSLVAFDSSLEIERRYFVKLATHSQSKNMIRTLWYFKNASEKQVGLPQTEADGFQKVGILGAGMMGAGLAFQIASTGYQVVLKDIRQEALDKALEHCQLLVQKKAKHKTEEERKEIFSRIIPTLVDSDLQGVDLVIEAVVENLELKHQVNKELEPFLAPNAVWASNTSGIPITALAGSSQQAHRFIGLHFFSPVEQMPLLEIVMGDKTDQETLARCLRFCKNIRKIPIVVNDRYGFYTTRVFSSFILEGAQLVAEGFDPVLVEWAAKSAGMVVPPLQVFDEINLKLGKHAIEQGEKYLQIPFDMEGIRLVKKMVDEWGRTGKSEGKGFYEYENGKRTRLWSGLREGVQKDPAFQNVQEMQDRLMLVQCVEVMKTIEEKGFNNLRDAEIGAIFGIGFAPNTGGPLSYMETLGLPVVLEKLKDLHQKCGERFAPPALLLEKVKTKEGFFDHLPLF